MTGLTTLQVGIYVYDDAEVLDFAAPYEVFSTASRVHARTAPDDPAPFVPWLVAETIRPVTARAGFVVTDGETTSRTSVSRLRTPRRSP